MDVEAAVRQVVTDLLPDADVAWRIGADGVEATVTSGDELVCTASADPWSPAREVVVHVADVVQAMAVERVGRAIPECPGHAHAGVLRATDHGVAWTCPSSRRVLTAYAVPDTPVAH